MAWAVWAFVFVYSIHAVLPENPIHLPGAAAVDMQRIVPQRWEFFTRPPSGVDSVVYKRTDGAWKRVDIGPSLGDWFGFGRTGLGLINEMALITSIDQEIPTTPCEGDPSVCFDRISSVLRVRNSTPKPYFCGDIGIALVKHPSWDEAQSVPRGETSTVARLEVLC